MSCTLLINSDVGLAMEWLTPPIVTIDPTKLFAHSLVQEHHVVEVKILHLTRLTTLGFDQEVARGTPVARIVEVRQYAMPVWH